MMKKMKVSPVQVRFDPLLWKDLPEELMECVISKLPFSKAVELRAVSKRWRSDIVPRAVRFEESRKSELLFFDTWWVPFPRWMKLTKSENGGTSCGTRSLLHFQPTPSFPTLRSKDHVELVNSEGGLLFLALVDSDLIFRKVVVYNPLTAQSRSLGLPRPIRGSSWLKNLLIGVVMDAKTQNYVLLVAGNDEEEHLTTFLYKSSSSTWVTGPSLLRAFRDIKVYRSTFFSSRSVCHDGNLYWDVMIVSSDRIWQFAVKFDALQETWIILEKQYPYLLKSWVQFFDNVPERFPNDEVVYSADHVWAFAPSLTSLP